MTRREIFGIVCCLLICGGIMMAVLRPKPDAYTRGEYGKYCYPLPHSDDRITHPLLFKTLSDCGRPIKS